MSVELLFVFSTVRYAYFFIYLYFFVNNFLNFIFM